MKCLRWAIAVGVLLLLSPSVVTAGRGYSGARFSFGFYGGGPVLAPPVYYAPPPVYYAPPPSPAYYYPAPAYVSPAPYYYAPPPPRAYFRFGF